MTSDRLGHGFTARRSVRLAATLLIGMLSFIPGTARASSSCFGNPTVTINATGVVFGNYDVLSAGATPGTGTVTVAATCDFSGLPFTVSYSIALNAGTASGGSFTPRDMASPSGAKLQYNLYTTAALTSIWGNGSGGTQAVTDSITGSCQGQFFGLGFTCTGSQSDTVYGEIPAMQNITAGNYSDTIMVTVTF